MQVESLLKPTRRSGKPSMSDLGMSAVGGDAARKLVLSACTVGGEARRPPEIEQGREAYLTGGAKLRYKRLTGQI